MKIDRYIKKQGFGKHRLHNMGHASDLSSRLDYYLCENCGRLFSVFNVTGEVTEWSGVTGRVKKEQLLKMAKSWGYEEPWMKGIAV